MKKLMYPGWWWKKPRHDGTDTPQRHSFTRSTPIGVLFLDKRETDGRLTLEASHLPLLVAGAHFHYFKLVFSPVLEGIILFEIQLFGIMSIVCWPVSHLIQQDLVINSKYLKVSDISYNNITPQMDHAVSYVCMMQGVHDVMTKCTMGSATSTIEPTNQMSFRKVDMHGCYWPSRSIDFSEKSSLEFFSESIINDNPGVRLLCKCDWGCLVRDKSPPSISWTWMVWISVLIFTSKLPKDCVCCLDAETFSKERYPRVRSDPKSLSVLRDRAVYPSTSIEQQITRAPGEAGFQLTMVYRRLIGKPNAS